MARRRKKDPRKAVKRTDLKRPCPSGKRGFKKEGEARAFCVIHSGKQLNVYRCPNCKDFHLADPVGRKNRQRQARGLAA